VGRDDVDVVVVATTNDMLAPVTLEAVGGGRASRRPAAVHPFRNV